jgi:hypothetical protein
MSILDYFDRLAIVHLPDRTDRYRALKREFSPAQFSTWPGN